MAASATHREAILRTAVSLFRRKGFAATGLNEIVAGSGAPKGSLYHYFPQGKAQLGAVAVTLAGDLVRDALQALADATDSPVALIGAYASASAAVMEDSEYREGCPIATMLLELAADYPDIAEAGRAALASWAGLIAASLVRSGVALDRAERLGSFAMAATEGALLQARVARSPAPILDAGDELAQLFAAAVELSTRDSEMDGHAGP